MSAVSAAESPSLRSVGTISPPGYRPGPRVESEHLLSTSSLPPTPGYSRGPTDRPICNHGHGTVQRTSNMVRSIATEARDHKLRWMTNVCNLQCVTRRYPMARAIITVPTRRRRLLSSSTLWVADRPVALCPYRLLACEHRERRSIGAHAASHLRDHWPPVRLRYLLLERLEVGGGEVV